MSTVETASGYWTEAGGCRFVVHATDFFTTTHDMQGTQVSFVKMKSLLTLFPNASPSCQAANPKLYETPNQHTIPNSKPQHHETPALGATVQGKAKGVPSIRVRFIGFRTRPLDPDNFAGGCKDLLDGLRHAGLIPGDEPWRIIFETTQEKVKSYSQERTLIEIEL